MRTVHCPLCGLRYTYPSELDAHAREDHAPPAQREGQHVIEVPQSRYGRARSVRAG